MHVIRLVMAFVVLIAVAGTVLIAPAQRAAALDGSGFDPGFIISDENFYSSTAMSEAEIQSFLDSMIGTCSNGQCLNVLRSDVASRARSVSDSTGNVRCEAFPGGSALLASTVIYRAQVACGISAKVILVTLQKEQALVTKKAPSREALDRAMGFACPDTAPCAVDSLGLANQIYKGTLQLKTYRAARFGLQPGVQPIRFSPTAACGSAVINVRNYATAALYNYTPYQPNAAALNNLGGIGDTCSAYGNRNFWVFYNNWFGSAGTAQGYIAIEQVYRLMSGATGTLGTAVTTTSSIAANGGGLVQGFQNGAIAWSAPRGAYVINGAIRTRFAESGGIAGLGWPSGAANSVSSGGGGLVQGFQHGAITSQSASGTHVIDGSWRARYGVVGGLASALGWPTSSVSCAPSGICVQLFQGGQMVSGSNRMPLEILTPMLSALNAAGGIGGPIGIPISGTNAIAIDGGGFVQAFEGGAMTVSAVGGNRLISGSIRTVFSSAGGIAGGAGWPTSDSSCTTQSVCSQSFRGGTAFTDQTGRGGFVSATVAGFYAAAGGIGGPLGIPLGGDARISANGGGTVQGFAGGALALPNAGGGYVLSGGLRAYYNSLGGVSGFLGWPTGPAACATPSVCSQAFTGGIVTWDDSSGGSVRAR